MPTALNEKLISPELELIFNPDGLAEKVPVDAPVNVGVVIVADVQKELPP